MNFFGIGGLELALVALAAFLLLGPKGIADGAKTIAKIARELRAQRDELAGIVQRAADEEADEQTARNAPPPPEGAVARLPDKGGPGEAPAPAAPQTERPVAPSPSPDRDART